MSGSRTSKSTFTQSLFAKNQSPWSSSLVASKESAFQKRHFENCIKKSESGSKSIKGSPDGSPKTCPSSLVSLERDDSYFRGSTHAFCNMLRHDRVCQRKCRLNTTVYDQHSGII